MVLMYVKYPLSLRNVEDLLVERGIDICHETVRLWWNRFGPIFAAELRRKRVDYEGEVLESFVTRTRDKAAALKFIKKALKRNGRPKAIVTDGLRSYRAAMTHLSNNKKQVLGRWAYTRAENSHLPFRRRERAMVRFRQMKRLKTFSAVHAVFHNPLNQDRHLINREIYRAQRSAALAEWTSLAT